ncbi:hypothetical protein B0H14DRAFT_2348603 [Mycena olivaceomarginata]|nr:hypothetical protein B0H14DRAFT_2348603 [Mycena olivaceomarginata]
MQPRKYLITTRNPGLCVHAPDSHYRLSDMEEADAVELLLRSSLTKSTPENEQMAREIVQVLYYFPPAIIQAVAYISKTSLGLERYLDLYMQNRACLLKEKPAQTQDGYAFTVYTIWEISFKCLSKPAVQLLQYCSFLHYEGITETMFSRAIHYKGTELGELGPTTEDLRDAREFLAQFVAPSGPWDSLTFEEVMAEIQGYSLIELDGQRKIYSIHPLVHTWTKRQEHPDTLSARASLATSYKALGQSKEAGELQAMVLEKRKLLLGEEHPDTLIAMGNLALSYRALGQSKQAAELEAVVLEKMKLLLGEEHLDTLIAMGNLALSYRALGQSREAAELEAVVLEKTKLLLGEEHPDTLVVMENLALSYRALGQSKQAAELEAVVLEKRKLILVEEHPDTLIAMGNLARSYSALGRSKEAADLRALLSPI